MNTLYSTIITKNTLSTCLVVSTIISLGLICFVGETICCPGCMDNSLHASQKYPYTCKKECDLKQFHHVECVFFVIMDKSIITILLTMFFACHSICAMHTQSSSIKIRDINFDSTIITSKKSTISINWFHNHRGTLIMAPFSYLSTGICSKLVYHAFESGDIDEKVFSLSIAVPVTTVFVCLHSILYYREQKRARQIQHHIEL